MAITLKTITGKIVIPGTTTGIRAKVTATPLTKAEALTFPSDNTLSWGPVEGYTDAAGNLPATFKIPTNSDQQAELLWRFVAEPVDKHTGLPKSWVMGEYQIADTGTVDIADLVDVEVTGINTATYTTIEARVLASTAAASSAAAGAESAAASATLAQTLVLADLGTTDGQSWALITNPASQTRGALWEIGPTAVNVAQYGVRAGETAATNNAGMAALLADHTGAVILGFPEIGVHEFTAPLPARDNLSVRGAGAGIGGMYPGADGTRLRFTNGMIVGDPTTDSTISSLHLADLSIDNNGGTKPLFDMGKTGLIQSTLERVDLSTEATGQPIFKSRAINVFGLKIRDSMLRRLAGATVPAFDVICAGGGVNGWTISESLVHSHGADTSPFFRFESTGTATYINNIVLRDLIGEQNVGGLAHFFGAMGCRAENVLEWDADTYADHLFSFDTSSTGCQSFACSVDNVGTPGYVTYAAGKNAVNFGSGYSHRSGQVWNGPQGFGTVGGAGVAEQRWGNGAARTLGVATGDLVLQSFHEVVVMDGTGVRTVTLPNPVTNTINVGREFSIKNRSLADNVQVTTAAGTDIDGFPAYTMAPEESARFICTGTNWTRL